jgi:anti-anti-sigma regulatory factor
MMFSSRQRAKALTLPVTLDMRNAQELKDRLLAALELNPVLQLDGSGTTHVATPGVQILLAAAQSAKSKGGNLVLIEPSSALEEAFHDLGLTHAYSEWRAANA